ncbi:UNVERIFIED_CONTAM: hypothetical protein NCL1_24141 [Trichonephila clavipes]
MLLFPLFLKTLVVDLPYLIPPQCRTPIRPLHQSSNCVRRIPGVPPSIPRGSLQVKIKIRKEKGNIAML